MWTAIALAVVGQVWTAIALAVVGRVWTAIALAVVEQVRSYCLLSGSYGLKDASGQVSGVACQI